jgi:hypothetical protein
MERYADGILQNLLPWVNEWKKFSQILSMDGWQPYAAVLFFPSYIGTYVSDLLQLTFT